MSGAGAGPIRLKPNKPEQYHGRRDFVIVNKWLYNMEHYFLILQLSNPRNVLTDDNKIIHLSTFLSSTAAVWWYTVVQSN